MYEMMPFDNMLTIVEIPGTVLQQFCDMMAAAKAGRSAEFPLL
jgi:hypothetical protein